MDIYADLPSAKPSSDLSVASSSSPASASKGSWAHSKFQGMIANRRTAVKAVSAACVQRAVVFYASFARQRFFLRG